MALIKCKECGADISEHAKKCPHCGVVITSANSQGQNKRSKSMWIWCVSAVIIISICVVFYLMQSPKTEKANNDNIHGTETANQAEVDAVSEEYVDINDFIERKPMSGSEDMKIPEFKDNIKNNLESMGYVITDTKRGTRDGEGEMDNYAIYTFEKKSPTNSQSWSRIVFDDGQCGGYTIYFCNNEQKDKFIESCKQLGYTQQMQEVGETILRIPQGENDYYDYYHENWNCIITLKNNSLTIHFGCV